MIIVATELIKRNKDEFLTLLVTVNIFQSGSNGKLTQSHNTDTQVRQYSKIAFCSGTHNV